MTEYRIDDLARASGTTTRNIRGYQERGLLPRPTRRGRTAIYTDWHLRHLRAINRLLSEGFTIKHITRFLTGLQRGAKLVDVLDLSDLSDLLEQRWSHPAEGTLTTDQLAERLGPLDAATLTKLIDAGLIRATSQPGSYLITDLETVNGFAALISRGMTLDNLAGIHIAMNRQIGEAARILITAAHEEVTRQRGAGWLPTTDSEIAWTADLVATMRRAATHSSHAAMDRALDEALRTELQLYQQEADAAEASPADTTGRP